MSNLCVQNHSVVAISYTLKADTEQILDLASPDAPLLYLHGGGFLLPAVEAALEGKFKKERVTLALAPEQGYGPYEARRVQEVPRASLETGQPLAVGMPFSIDAPGGHLSQTFYVKSIKDDVVELDGNHPLAGQTLHFDITVEFVRWPTPEERQAGRALENQYEPRKR